MQRRGPTRPKRLAGRGGQSTLEYAVFIGVVAAALVAMHLYVRRGIQAHLRQVERRINAEALE